MQIWCNNAYLCKLVSGRSFWHMSHTFHSNLTFSFLFLSYFHFYLSNCGHSWDSLPHSVSDLTRASIYIYHMNGHTWDSLPSSVSGHGAQSPYIYIFLTFQSLIFFTFPHISIIHISHISSHFIISCHMHVFSSFSFFIVNYNSPFS